ncbi:MAG: roadblock/LC7 domain-containing protein [Candidatus Methanoperedenaceae archaeon]|nr:roadblock/LC7 domain-containing protein [Candidatus Methanoperedenaceae archaeon]
MMNTIELIEKMLADLKKVRGVEACAAVSREGLLISAIMQNKRFAESFAAMSATMLGAAETVITELNKGVPNRVIVESKHGMLIAVGAGPKALVVVLVDSDAGLGMVLLELEKSAEKLKELLS